MPELAPFSALRYAPSAGDLSLLLAPPYDVIDEDGARVLRNRSAYNCVRLILPQGPGDERYVEAATTLRQWILDGVLEVDPEPAVYVYRQRFTADRQETERLAVFAAVRLTPFADGHIIPHERTHSGPKRDRLALTLATRTQLSPIFMVARDAEGALYDLERTTAESPPDVAATTADGIGHAMWIVSGPAAGALLSAAGSHPLLIADGHHRYETALVAAEALGDNVKAAFLLICVVSQRDPGLVVRPTHRILSRPPNCGYDPFDWIGALSHSFDLRDLGALAAGEAERRAAAEGSGSFIVAPAGAAGMWLASARPGALAAAGVGADRALVAPVVFDELVLAALYGLEADEASRSGILGYARDADAVASVPAGGCGFVLPPVSLDDVWATAVAGGRLPPKSTYFEPKMPSGLLFRPL